MTVRTYVALSILVAACLITRLAAADSHPPTDLTNQLFRATRAGDRAGVRILLQTGANIRARDDQGNTPLMIAAFGADADLVELLLGAGGEVNATNQAGATALMRAAPFEDKARLLVKAGADVRSRSALGNTALILAARRPGNVRTVKLLLDRGAVVNATNVFGATPLMAAAAAEDADSVRLLLDRGADVNARPSMDGDGFIWGGGRTPLMWAAFRGNSGLVKMFLARGAKVDGFTLAGGALAQAAWGGRVDVAKILLEAGAPVDQRDLVGNFTPLHWAASSERLDPGLAQLLIEHRADVNAEGGQPVNGFLGSTFTPLQLARKRGETPIAQVLLKSGARNEVTRDEKRSRKPARVVEGAVDDTSVASAIRMALPPLARTATQSAASFRKHASRQTCVSCHQQELPLSAISLARSRGFGVDESAAHRAAELTREFGAQLNELDLQAAFHPEPAIGNGYALLSLHLDNQPGSAGTDALVHQLAVTQQPDGSWPWNLPRPPIQSSAIGATALAVHSLRHYPIPGRQREFTQRIQRARQWLAKAAPETTEERAYQLLGLSWAGESAGKLRALAAGLIREQRSDGGWAQLANLESDAYATGLSLYALEQTAGLSGRHSAVENGVSFLLRTQLDDGTWFVRRRAFPFQPPMDSGFAHGADGWISAAASSWAVMALSLAVDSSKVPSTLLAALPATNVDAAKVAVAKAETPIEFARDIRPLLERSCVTCHSGERAKGGFRVTDRAAFLRGGQRGQAAIVPGQAHDSPLLRYVTDQLEDLEMPPVGKRHQYPALSRDEVARLGAWVEQGAVWPTEVTLKPGRK